MHKRSLLAALLAVCFVTLAAKDIYVSTSFHEPATEGLRFIYSEDGVKWDSIEGVFKKEMDRRGVDVLEVGDKKVRCTTVLSNRFDTTGFKKKYGELYKLFTKTVESKRFSVS